METPQIRCGPRRTPLRLSEDPPEGLGSELALQIRSTQRWVRVLFMSSYSREHLLKHGVDVPEAQFLKKPFVAAQLVSSIREVLSA